MDDMKFRWATSEAEFVFSSFYANTIYWYTTTTKIQKMINRLRKSQLDDLCQLTYNIYAIISI